MQLKNNMHVIYITILPKLAIYFTETKLHCIERQICISFEGDVEHKKRSIA